MADILYTGKGLTPNLQSDGGKAMSRLSDFITKAENIKYQAFKENEDWIVKAQDVDPAFLISQAQQNEQVKKLDVYNEKWAEVMRRSGGKLTTQDKLDMQAERNLLEAWQNEATTKQQLAEQHRSLVSQNPLRYDSVRFRNAYDSFVKTGNYDLLTPPLKSKNPALYLQEQSNKLNKEKILYGKPLLDSKGRTTDRFTNIPEDKIGDFIENAFMGDDQVIQGLTEEFLADNSPEKWALLEDINGDGRITNEDVDENAVMAWAKRNPKYIDAVRKVTSGTPKNPPSSTTKTPTFDWNKPVTADYNRNNEFTVAGTTKAGTEEGTFTFPDYINLGRVSFTSDPQNISEVVKINSSGREEIIPLNETARFDVVGYSPSKDQLIIKLADKTSDYTYGQGNVLVVPATRFDDLLKSKPFGIFRKKGAEQNTGKKKAYTKVVDIH